MQNDFGSGDKIRVGFVFSYVHDRWIGGYNYFRNLISAISSLPKSRICPVIITGHQLYRSLPDEFKNIETVCCKFIDRWTIPWLLRHLNKRLLDKDFLLYNILKKHNIHVLSHSGHLGIRADIPCLCWIPDFQHLYLPEYFSRLQLYERNRYFKDLCRKCQGIILSSQAAKSDLEKYYPAHRAKLYVLHFVAKLVKGYEKISFDYLAEKYNIKSQYFHLPNQFWAHKNHDVVIEALRILKEKGKEVLVVATGNPVDYRKSGTYKNIMQKIREYGIKDQFNLIGVVPYKELMAIMLHSIAVINPSFFEGWSSTVEEAKSMGKRIILSDIPVHREQKPARGIYFTPGDPEELAEILSDSISVHHPDEERQFLNQANHIFSKRVEIFAQNYEQIVLDFYD